MLSYLYYNIDQPWNRVVYGTIYADQLLKKLILPNFTKNLSGIWKLDLKPSSRKVKTKMSMIQLSEKFKKIFFLLEQFHANHAVIITFIPY